MRRYAISIEKRMAGSSGGVFVMRLLAFLLAAALTYILLLLTGGGAYKASSAMRALFIKPFFTGYGILDTLTRAIPLTIASIGVAFAFRMKLWNIGAEGQITVGAIAASLVALAQPGLPSYILLPLMMLAAFAAGAAWALIAGVPRALIGVNETIVTLMLNYIAITLAQYLVYGPMKDQSAIGFPVAPYLPSAARLMKLMLPPLHQGLYLAIALIALYAFLIYRSRFGYEIRVIGNSEATARYAGMGVRRTIVLLMAISGGVAALAGFAQLAGSAGRMEVSIAAGFGYTAIIIAWLARLNPIGILAMSIVMSGLLIGGDLVQMSGYTSAVATIIQGFVLFFVLGLDFFTGYKLRITPKGEVS